MPDQISLGRRNFGRYIIWGSAIFLILTVLLQSLDQTIFLTFGFENWRPTLYAYLLWAFCLCLGQVILYGEQGKRRLFILPAVLFVISVVIFPLIFALGIAFSSWNRILANIRLHFAQGAIRSWRASSVGMASHGHLHLQSSV